MFNRIRKIKTVRRFGEQGQLAIMWVVLLGAVIFPVIGLGVDGGRMLNVHSLYQQYANQSARVAASLPAGTTGQGIREQEMAIDNYLKNLPNVSLDGAPTDFGNATVCVTVETIHPIPTIFLGIVGIRNFSVRAKGCARGADNSNSNEL
jgi:hypothetical protein